MKRREWKKEEKEEEVEVEVGIGKEWENSQASPTDSKPG